MTTTFSDLIKKAAEDFPNFSTAFAQFKKVGDGIAVRLQAMEIMSQFVGSVNYGIGGPNNLFVGPSVSWWLLLDPKGLLFYHDASEFLDVTANFKYSSWPGPQNFKIVKVDFTRVGEDHNIFARVRTLYYVISFVLTALPLSVCGKRRPSTNFSLFFAQINSPCCRHFQFHCTLVQEGGGIGRVPKSRRPKPSLTGKTTRTFFISSSDLWGNKHISRPTTSRKSVSNTVYCL